MRFDKRISKFLAKLILPSFTVSSIGCVQISAMGDDILVNLKTALKDLSRDDQLDLLNILYEGVQIFRFEQPNDDVYYNAAQYSFYELLDLTIVSEHYTNPLYISPSYTPARTVSRQKFEKLKNTIKSFFDVFINDKSKYVMYLPELINFCEEGIKNGKGTEIVDDYQKKYLNPKK